MIENKFNRLIGATLLFATLIVILSLIFGSFESFISDKDYTDASRMINGIFAGLLTSMSVLITLSGNLYSPRLIRVFVTHPIVIFGISIILICNFLILLNQLVPEGHVISGPSLIYAIVSFSYLFLVLYLSYIT